MSSQERKLTATRHTHPVIHSGSKCHLSPPLTSTTGTGDNSPGARSSPASAAHVFTRCLQRSPGPECPNTQVLLKLSLTLNPPNTQLHSRAVDLGMPRRDGAQGSLSGQACSSPPTAIDVEQERQTNSCSSQPQVRGFAIGIQTIHFWLKVSERMKKIILKLRPPLRSSLPKVTVNMSCFV